MSWEEVPPQIKPCWCGKSTIAYVMAMDDWNRTRTSRTINCPDCLTKHIAEEDEKSKKTELRKHLHKKAKTLAADRYQDAWLLTFSGLNKKQAWGHLPHEGGYPSLGTFYKHTKDEGLQNYLIRQFENNFEGCLKKMGVSDETISAIINERDNI